MYLLLFSYLCVHSLCMYSYIYLFVCLFTHSLFICLPITYLFIHLFIHCLFTCCVFVFLGGWGLMRGGLEWFFCLFKNKKHINLVSIFNLLFIYLFSLFYVVFVCLLSMCSLFFNMLLDFLFSLHLFLYYLCIGEFIYLLHYPWFIYS